MGHFPASVAGLAGDSGKRRVYSGCMVEVSGDSSRNGDWALVRLRLDGERIVEADADGLDSELRGLSLIEAATVGGEELAVDALEIGRAHVRTPVT